MLWRVFYGARRAIRRMKGVRPASPEPELDRTRGPGEGPNAFTIRLATTADVPALARLHVQTYNETHEGGKPTGPTYEIRAWQWRGKIAETDATSFCLIVETWPGEMVGFAYVHPVKHPDFASRLNKIYFLQAYQRLGLGRRLLGRVTDRLLAEGVSSMILFTEVDNPACFFYEALGAERLLGDSGEFEGAYGWRDLKVLAGLTSSQPGHRPV